MLAQYRERLDARSARRATPRDPVRLPPPTGPLRRPRRCRRALGAQGSRPAFTIRPPCRSSGPGRVRRGAGAPSRRPRPGPQRSFRCRCIPICSRRSSASPTRSTLFSKPFQVRRVTMLKSTPAMHDGEGRGHGRRGRRGGRRARLLGSEPASGPGRQPTPRSAGSAISTTTPGQVPAAVPGVPDHDPHRARAGRPGVDAVMIATPVHTHYDARRAGPRGGQARVRREAARPIERARRRPGRDGARAATGS